MNKPTQQFNSDHMSDNMKNKLKNYQNKIRKYTLKIDQLNELTGGILCQPKIMSGCFLLSPVVLDDGGSNNEVSPRLLELETIGLDGLSDVLEVGDIIVVDVVVGDVVVIDPIILEVGGVKDGFVILNVGGVESTVDDLISFDLLVLLSVVLVALSDDFVDVVVGDIIVGDVVVVDPIILEVGGVKSGFVILNVGGVELLIVLFDGLDELSDVDFSDGLVELIFELVVVVFSEGLDDPKPKNELIDPTVANEPIILFDVEDTGVESGLSDIGSVVFVCFDLVPLPSPPSESFNCSLRLIGLGTYLEDALLNAEAILLSKSLNLRILIIRYNSS